MDDTPSLAADTVNNGTQNSSINTTKMSSINAKKAATATAKTAAKGEVQAAIARMLAEFRNKPPCFDDIVVVPLAASPDVQQQFPISTRSSDGFCRIESICGIAVSAIGMKEMTKVCSYYKVSGVSSSTKLQCCEALIERKVSIEQGLAHHPLLDEPVVGKTSKKGRKKTTSTKDPPPVPNFQGNYIRLINCIFHPDVREDYAKFNCQPNKDVLTNKKVANQDFCERIVTLYNGDASLVDDDDDDDDDTAWEIDKHQVEHPNFLHKVARYDPAKHDTIMPCWKSAHSMIKTLHSEYAVVQTNWKKSGEHKDATDVLANMVLDIVDDPDMNDTERSLFVIANQKCLYYFLMLAQFGADFFAAVTASLPEGVGLDTGKPKASGRAKGRGSTGRAGAGRGRQSTQIDSAISELAGAHHARQKLKLVSMLQGQIKHQHNLMEKLETKMEAKKKRFRQLHVEEKASAGLLSQDSLLSTADSSKADYKRLQGEYNDAKAMLESFQMELAAMLPSATALATVTAASGGTTKETTPKRRLAASAVTASNKTKRSRQKETTTVDSSSSDSESEVVVSKPAARPKPSKLFLPSDDEM